MQLDEAIWGRAKARALEQHPEFDPDSDRLYRVALGIYEQMSGRGKLRKALDGTGRILRAVLSSGRRR